MKQCFFQLLPVGAVSPLMRGAWIETSTLISSITTT